jgi:hypothetical protein
VEVHGPSTGRPFYKICSNQELLKFNQKQNGEPKKYMGTGTKVEEGDSQFWYKICWENLKQERNHISRWLHSFLQSNINTYLQKSNIWNKG